MSRQIYLLYTCIYLPMVSACLFCLFVWLVGFFCFTTAAKVEDREEYNKIQQIQYYSKDIIRGLKDMFLCSKLTKSSFENIFMSVYLCLGFFVVVVLFFAPCEGLLP